MTAGSDAYKKAGVDIQAASQTKDEITEMVRSTFRPEVLTDIGGFGGLFRPQFKGMEDPVIVSSVDGVGTKLKVAVMMNCHNTVGSDLVNHCVDDILAMGAQPLFFLDYMAYQKHDGAVVKALISGIASACKENNCALIGGEMAELTDMYHPGEYDLAGTIVGVVDRCKIIDGSTVCEGDVLVGLPSTGLHTNGYTLARSVLFDKAGYSVDDHLTQLGMTVGEALLKTHRSYLPLLSGFLGDPGLHGLSHITGGGFEGNVNRVLPGTLNARINVETWTPLPVFQLIREKGNITGQECYRTFNMGIGMVAILSPDIVDKFSESLNKKGMSAPAIGEIIPGKGIVELKGI